MKANSILQKWVTRLGLRYQGVLLAAIRGCDGWEKHHKGKPLIRELRGLVLVPFDVRELTYNGGFMVSFPHAPAEKSFDYISGSLDEMNLHYVLHLIHAIEVIGYEHKDKEVRSVYNARYLKLVSKLHMLPEESYHLRHRMEEDRIASNTVGK